MNFLVPPPISSFLQAVHSSMFQAYILFFSSHRVFSASICLSDGAKGYQHIVYLRDMVFTASPLWLVRAHNLSLLLPWFCRLASFWSSIVPIYPISNFPVLGKMFLWSWPCLHLFGYAICLLLFFSYFHFVSNCNFSCFIFQFLFVATQRPATLCVIASGSLKSIKSRCRRW